ncbi:hypothetical protein GYMLUDRAFT_100795 [Collybiopsis luxurians FD-317 M1]|uniref:Uncharacterized protein n=1 Tax=Collybiopsis luxurians FD-317 M1 TaxID=944289 RepID=A0A0D0BRD4_9AGAR|nr:hypothetical protein GYMLUDRAFT_100795 [Collybiopsis luxurians FD-317 M1]
MFQKQVTEAELGHFPQDHKGICTIKMKEDGRYWHLQTGMVYAWVNENANSLDAQSSHAHIKAARQFQDGYNYSITGAVASTGPSGSVTGGKNHNTTTQMFRPFYTVSAAAKNEHGTRGQAFQVKRADKSGILTGDPELALEITIDSAKDQAVSMNIETYWRLAPVRKRSDYNHKDPFRSLEALFICHELAIPNIFRFSSYSYDKLAFQGHADGSYFIPRGVVPDSRAVQRDQITGHRILAGAKTRSLPGWHARFLGLGKRELLSLDMVLFRHENGRTTREETRLEWQNIPNSNLLLRRQ